MFFVSCAFRFFCSGCTCSVNHCLGRSLIIDVKFPSGNIRPFYAVLFGEEYRIILSCLSTTEDTQPNRSVCSGKPIRESILGGEEIPNELNVEMSFGENWHPPTQFFTVKVRQGDTYEDHCVADCADHFVTVPVGE